MSSVRLGVGLYLQARAEPCFSVSTLRSFVVPAPPKTSGSKDPLELYVGLLLSGVWMGSGVDFLACPSRLLDEIRTYSLSIANLQSYESALAPASKKTPFLTMRGEKEVAVSACFPLVLL